MSQPDQDQLRVIDGAKDDCPAKVLPPPAEPMQVARRLLPKIAPNGTLRSWRDTWMRWQGTHWVEQDRRSVRAELYRRTDEAEYWFESESGKVAEYRHWAPTKRKIADLTEALEAHTHLDADVEPPAWIGKHQHPAGEYVSVRNGLLHIGERKLTPHTPEFFNEITVPFDFVRNADAGEWGRFLNQLWPDDPESIALLRQWFGYVLSGRTDLQKILLLIGPKRSGKGTIARTLSALIGEGNVAGPTLASLGTNFGLSPLLGKPLAVVGDARPAGAQLSTVVERLLSISGEDLLTVDRKYRDPWSGRIPARLMLLSNELPRFGDASAAIASRFLILHLNESWLGREDSRLEAKLRAALPGILNWSLTGLEEITAGRFNEPESSHQARRDLEYLVSPIKAFLSDCCHIGPAESVEKAALYKNYRNWCTENGYRPTDISVFARDLFAAEPTIQAERHRTGDRREQRFGGVSLVKVTLQTTPDHPGHPWPNGHPDQGGQGSKPTQP